jgi:heat shock protein HslJ
VLDTSALGVAGAQDVKATLAFERDGVAGSDGCNRIFGPYDQDETRLELGPLASTKMACAGAAGEVADRVSPALGQVASFSLDGDRLTLRDAGGRALLAYVRGSAA